MKRLLCWMFGHKWHKSRFGKKTFVCRRCLRIETAGEPVPTDKAMSQEQFTDWLLIHQQTSGLKFNTFNEWAKRDIAE